MKKLFILAICSTLLFSSCGLGGKRIRGNGVIKTETRTAGNFNSIDVSGATHVYVKQDSVFSIKVETDENLLQYIIIENRNGTLDIHQKEGTNLKSSRAVKVYVSAPSFSRFEASGACNYFSENQLTGTGTISISLSGASDVNMDLKAPKIEADLSGAGTVTLRGEAKDFRVGGSGSTNVRCFELMTENTDINLSGAGDAEVFASVKLDVSVSGSGDVKYKGNAVVNQQVSGAGTVRKVN